METTTISVVGEYDCVLCERQQSRYGAWLVRFEDRSTNEAIILLTLPQPDAPFEVGKTYSLTVGAQQIGK